MNGKRSAALLVAAFATMAGASPVSADELDAGFSDPALPRWSVPQVPAGLYLVTDVYAGEVISSSGNTTTYSTVTVPDVPGTYARVVDVVGSGEASDFDDRSFNGRSRLSDGRSIAGTYYEDFVLTAAGFVSVNIVFFQDDAEAREAARPSPAATARTASGTSTPASSPSPSSSVGQRVAPSATPAPSSDLRPAPLPTFRTAVATAGVALASDGPVLASIEVLRGRTVQLWPRAFADGVAVPIRSWRLVSGGADRLAPLSGSAAEACEASWLSLPTGGAPAILRFEVTSDALPGRVMTASVSVTVRSPALLQ